MALPTTMFDKVRQYQDASMHPCDLVANAASCFRRGIVLTSAYSGIGSFELASSVIQDNMFELVGGTPAVTVYSACDIDSKALQALAAHSDRTRARHRFCNVLDRVHPAQLQALRRIEKHYLDLWDDTKRERAVGAVDEQELRRWHERLSSEYLVRLMEEFSGIEFLETAYCAEHDAQCPLSPRSDPELSQKLWVEGAGSVCTPFSKTGPQDHWLSSATLVFFTWFASTLYYEPDAILHECVDAFPSCIFATICEAAVSWPRCILSRTGLAEKDCERAGLQADSDTDGDTGGDQERAQTSEWGFMSAIFSPKSLGIPVARTRKYTWGWLRSHLTVDERHRFLDMFGARLCCDAGCILSAATSRECSQEELLSAGYDARLEGVLLQAARAGKCDASFEHWAVKFGLTNITQNASHARIAYDVVPTLTRRFKLYEVVSKKLVDIPHLWAAQGFAHPDLSELPEQLAEYFPCQSLVTQGSASSSSRGSAGGQLSNAAQQSLLGNAMHLAQVSAWFAFCLAVSCPSVGVAVQSASGRSV
jgi:hypothetical protein